MCIRDSLWDIIYDSPNLQGGFIWDFMDQGFKVKTEPRDGRTSVSYTHLDVYKRQV